MPGKFLPLLCACATLAACASDESVKVAALQKKDKSLGCSEIMLEINEAEFYRKAAENNKNIKVKSLLMPLGYISTYMDAEDATSAANARIDYLNRIYDILRCEELVKQPPAAPAAYPQPQRGVYYVVPGAENREEHFVPQSYAPPAQPVPTPSPYFHGISYRTSSVPQDDDGYW